MTSCSNGFVVDLEPPMKGHVEVTTMRGLTVPVDSHVRVTWGDFKDKIAQVMTGYVNGIKGYEVALGIILMILHFYHQHPFVYNFV